MSEKETNLSGLIAENFGANASYVEALLTRFRADRASVDESWQEYFDELLNEKNGTAAPAASATAQPAEVKASATPVPAKKVQPQPAAAPDANAKALVGSSKKIVENMEQSLSVPTATSRSARCRSRCWKKIGA